MKNIVFLFCSVLLLSCSTIQQTETSTVQLELLEKYALPSIPPEIYRPNLKISARMLINREGKVQEVKLLTSSGNNLWDTDVISALKKWRYTAPVVDNVPSTVWIRQDIRVMIGEPNYISFYEILCADVVNANEVYEALKRGEDINVITLKYSVDPLKAQGSIHRKVDVNQYPEYLKKEILRLSTGEFSQPIRYGDNYIIFKKNGV
jgi:TonB family protein